MKCKGCGKDIEGTQYKNVAQWAFCPECFETLMDKRGREGKAGTEKSPERSAEILKTSGQKPRCTICEKEIEKETGRKMLGLTFCTPCYEGLIKRPEMPPRAEEPDIDINEKKRVPQVRVDVRSTVQCSWCGRQIPTLGSKEFDDKPYCPDCYKELPEVKAKEPKAFPFANNARQKDKGEPIGETDSKEFERLCQACLAKVTPDNVKNVEGFEICMPCLSTDPDTALTIARARHRKALEKIREELGG